MLHCTVVFTNKQEPEKSWRGIFIALNSEKRQIKGLVTAMTTPYPEACRNCSRCRGLMVEDDLLDIRESHVPMWIRGLRCVSCGNIVDPVIHRNRMRRQIGESATLRRDDPRLFRPRLPKAA